MWWLQPNVVRLVDDGINECWMVYDMNRAERGSMVVAIRPNEVRSVCK
jgi:hypothetical protein